jgi:hypothetical protein
MQKPVGTIHKPKYSIFTGTGDQFVWKCNKKGNMLGGNHILHSNQDSELEQYATLPPTPGGMMVNLEKTQGSNL